MSTNVVVITGRLGKDPEVRAANGGKTVCSFSLAVDDGYGENKKTSWVPCEVWDKTAEAVARLVKSGCRVTAVGSIREDTWTDQNNNKRSRLKVVASKVDIIDFADKPSAGDNDDIPF